ncbi:hypothetical protein GOP47_0003841 [Adiantum capillus-veneris]|uniref:Uncharacterized protein n=1 Tax=Adiantum capillus-veneris TaxID=13818 RepID=A0A9D4V7M7_ADICA|nr:hypothetical protein GOP47_0003841 [Adiantum capillus-veneris]
MDPPLCLVELDCKSDGNNEYTCFYKEGCAIDTMLLDNTIWDETLSSLLEAMAMGQVLEDHKDEVGLQDVMVDPCDSVYMEGLEDAMLEDATYIESCEKLMFVEESMICGCWICF